MKSSLSRAPRQNMNAEEIQDAAKIAWRKRGWVAIQVDGIIGDDWLKQAITNYAIKLYGERE